MHRGPQASPADRTLKKLASQREGLGGQVPVSGQAWPGDGPEAWPPEAHGDPCAASPTCLPIAASSSSVLSSAFQRESQLFLEPSADLIKDSDSQ